MTVLLFIFFFNRKLAFKQYEERKLAAEKIIKETGQLEGLFGKHKASVSIEFAFTVDLQWLEHGWLIYHSCFELVQELLKMVYCLYSLESPRGGDSNEKTQYKGKGKGFP